MWTPDHHTHMRFVNMQFKIQCLFTVITFWSRAVGFVLGRSWCYRSYQRCSLCLRSGLCAGQFSSFAWALVTYIFLALALCPGASSYWSGFSGFSKSQHILCASKFVQQFWKDQHTGVMVRWLHTSHHITYLWLQERQKKQHQRVRIKPATIQANSVNMCTSSLKLMNTKFVFISHLNFSWLTKSWECNCNFFTNFYL